MPRLGIRERSERRRQSRLRVPKGRVIHGEVALAVLDVSNSGFAVEVLGKCAFARDDLHRFILSDEQHAVEVDGRVCWVETGWEGSSESETHRVTQRAGIALIRIRTPIPKGVWRALTPYREPSASTATPVERSVAEIERPPSPVRIVAPPHGTVTSSFKVRILGLMEEPDSIASVIVNGVQATLTGKEFSADLRLHEGDNKISATVLRTGGSYCTYHLGTLLRRHPPRHVLR